MNTQEFDKAVTSFVEEYRILALNNAFGIRKDGGPGSGNFGHKGRPGEIGGSESGQVHSVDNKYFPDKDSWRRDLNQGWNKERNAYLSDRGHSKEQVKEFNQIMERHVQYADIDEALGKFANKNPDFIKDVVSFEIKAASLRREDEINKAEKDIQRSKDYINEIKNGVWEWMGDNEYVLEAAQSQLKLNKQKRSDLDKPITLYRKGGYDDTCLSFSTSRDGVTLYAGTDHEEWLFPDHESTIDELEQDGIYPICGFGAKYNFYSGEGSEIVCINLKNSESNRKDGGPGSGNFGHAGVPGQIGGSAPGNGSRAVVQGKDISASYKGDGSIKDVLHAQGFDGLPKIVGKEEFDKAVKESKFIAQRTYSATSQEILDAYRDQLYNGEFYVDCSVGGAQYGQGMYCAADYNGELTEGIRKEMEHYRDAYSEYGRVLTHEEWMKNAEDTLNEAGFDDWTGEKRQLILDWANAYHKRDHQASKPLMEKIPESIRDNLNHILSKVKNNAVQPHYTETFTLDPSAKIVTSQDLLIEKKDFIEAYERESIKTVLGSDASDIEQAMFRYTNTLDTKEDRALIHGFRDEDGQAYRDLMESNREKWKKMYRGIKAKAKGYARMDDGSFAAMLGYDAINAEGHGASGSYTAVLNRTKCIFLNENEDSNTDSSSIITFQYDEEGNIWAVREGKVIGAIYSVETKKETKEDSKDIKPLKTIKELRYFILGLALRTDEDPAAWITVNGNHIPLDENKTALGGAGSWATGKLFSEAIL